MDNNTAIAARALHSALPEAAGLSIADIQAALSRPPDAAMGDLAFPCFKLAKPLRRAPPHIAADLAVRLAGVDGIASAQAAGPYVNVRLAVAGRE